MSIAKSAIIVIFVVLIGKILGFLRDITVAYIFGISAVMDAYSVAVNISNIAILIVAVYFTQIFIPTYTSIREKQSEEKALTMANNAFGIFLIVSIVLMFIFMLLAPLILRMTGFDEQSHNLALTAVRIILLSMPLVAFIQFSIGYLMARKSFLGQKFMDIPANIVFIALGFVVVRYGGIVELSSAWVMIFVVQFFVMIIWMYKERYRPRFSFHLNTPDIRSDIRLLIPAVLSTSAIVINVWIDTVIASHLGVGYAASIGFATRLVLFAQSLIIIPIAGIIFSHMSEYAAKNNITQMLNTLWHTARVTLFIIVPILIIAIPSGFDIVRIAYERGEFTPEATVLTGTALIWSLPKLLGLTVLYFTTNFYLALKDIKKPLIANVIALVVNIFFSIWLSSFMGIAGIALATVIGKTLAAVILLVFLYKEFGHLSGNFLQKMVSILKILLYAIPCAVAVMITRYTFIDSLDLLRFFVVTVIGGAVYLFVAFILKEPVMLEFFQ